MHMQQSPYEITHDQLQIRDMSQSYLRVQQNTEFLTHLLRHQQGRRRQILTPNSIQVEYQSFFSLAVQTSYLLYTCCIRKVSVFLSNNIYLQNRDNTLNAIREYLLESEYLAMSQQRKRLIEKNFFNANPFKSESAYSQHVLRINRLYLDSLSSLINKDKKIGSNQEFLRCFENYKMAIRLLTPHENTLRPKVLISCLEETEVFRKYSDLLRVLNCSIYESIRKRGKFKMTLQEIREKEMELTAMHSKILEQNREKQLQFLQNSIDGFVKYLLKENIIEVQLSQNSNSTESKQSKLGTCEQSKVGEERIWSWKIKVEEKRFRELTKDLIQEIEKGSTLSVEPPIEQTKNKVSVFNLQFISSRKLISVKYNSDIEVNVENTDALLYYCNNMMLEWNNISVQQIEKEQNKNSKKREKCLAFKVVSYFNVTDSPFINILLLIDQAMIYAKVSEPEINRKPKLDDQYRFVTAGRRINHLTRMFVNKIRRLYEINANEK